MRRMFEFVCLAQHWHEALVDDALRVHQCPECERTATRIISAPRCQLEGITGSFPSAYDAWNRKRESHIKREKAYKRNNNEHLPSQKPMKPVSA